VTGGRFAVGVAVAVAVTLVLVACSGDDDAAPSTTLAAPPTSVEAPSSTVAATTPETTEPAPVSTPTTPATPTSPPPTTPSTLPPEPTTTTGSSSPPNQAQIKQDVIDATITAWTAFNELLLDPTDDERLSAIAGTRTADALDRVIDIVLQLQLEGRKSVTNPDLPATIRIDRSSAMVDVDRGTATVEYCRLGSNITVEIGGNEDGTDRILDDTINSYLESDTFVLENGVWLKSGGQTIEIFEGARTCDESSN
jgi:hypothetical protein